jgi:hypothetical protein
LVWVSDQGGLTSGEPGPDTLAARSELAELIAEAAGGLSDRDRAVLELAYRHGPDGPERAAALEVSHDLAKKVTRNRTHVVLRRTSACRGCRLFRDGG